jgi:prophage tail gpP-like protein
LFKIDVVVRTDVGEPFPDATIERHETGFAFLERLCRLRPVLATDDEQGRLVLTRAGSDRAHDALLQGPGGNVQWASVVIHRVKSGDKPPAHGGSAIAQASRPATKAGPAGTDMASARPAAKRATRSNDRRLPK